MVPLTFDERSSQKATLLLTRASQREKRRERNVPPSQPQTGAPQAPIGCIQSVDQTGQLQFAAATM